MWTGTFDQPSHVCHRDAPQARGVHLVFGHQVEHHVERDPAFHPGEGRAEAAVDAVPEIEVVPGRYPVDIESVGFGKGPLVAGCRAVDQHDDAVGGNGRPVQCHVARAVPKRALLGLALFIGQAFLYNAVTFNLVTLLSDFYGVASGIVPAFFIIWAASNFAGPVVLGRLFDTVGRKPMITLSYLGSAAVAVVLAAVFAAQTGGLWMFMAVLMVCFFLASSGASAAYLTVSEIFPMETRALAIAFFYAVGTAVGGITGPLLFGQLIESGNRGPVAVGFLIGAAVMAIGGIAELLWGVNAEGQTLEDIAAPLTAA